MDIKEVLLLQFIFFFYKNSTSLADKFARDCGFKSDIKQKEKLAEELHKPIIKTFLKRELDSLFKDNIKGDDLAGMQLKLNLIKEFIFYYVSLIFLVNIHGCSFKK